MSIVISIGRFGRMRFKVERTRNGIRVLRIVAGWIGVIIVNLDLDYEWSTGAKKASKASE